MQNGFGLLPNCIVKKKYLYCNLGFVLQEEGWLHERVSQYKNCIVTGAAGGLGKMYCKRRGFVLQYEVYCKLARLEWLVLCCNTTIVL